MNWNLVEWSSKIGTDEGEEGPGLRKKERHNAKRQLQLLQVSIVGVQRERWTKSIVPEEHETPLEVNSIVPRSSWGSRPTL
jgi:hypothetical protein